MLENPEHLQAFHVFAERLGLVLIWPLPPFNPGVRPLPHCTLWCYNSWNSTPGPLHLPLRRWRALAGSVLRDSRSQVVSPGPLPTVSPSSWRTCLIPTLSSQLECHRTVFPEHLIRVAPPVPPLSHCLIISFTVITTFNFLAYLFMCLLSDYPCEY